MVSLLRETKAARDLRAEKGVWLWSVIGEDCGLGLVWHGGAHAWTAPPVKVGGGLRMMGREEGPRQGI